VGPAHARSPLRLPAPVATALGAVVVAGLAFGGLTLASGSTLRPGGSAPAEHGSSGAPVTTTAPLIGGPRLATPPPKAPLNSGGPGGPGGSGGIIPVTGPVTTTPRILPSPSTGCQGATIIPDVDRQTYPASSQTLLAAGFPGLDIAEHSSTVAVDHTISVSPAVGTLEPCGTEVTLVYSSGPAPAHTTGPPTPLCTLPPANGAATTVLATLHALVASDRSTACDLLVTEMTGYSAAIPAGNVISENPLAGTQVGVRSAVIITVSLGPPTCKLPPVVGDAKAAATALLTALKTADGSDCALVVTTVTAASATVPVGTVAAQDPEAGTMAAPGSLVTLTVSSGPATSSSASASASTSPSASSTSASPTPSTTPPPTSPSSAPPSTTPSVSTAPSASASTSAAAPASCTLPPVTGLTAAAASAAFAAVVSSAGTDCGLVVDEVEDASSTVAAGLVISQAPAAGGTVAPGSAVSIDVSTGPAASASESDSSPGTSGSASGSASAF